MNDLTIQDHIQIFKLFVGLEPTATQSAGSRGRDYGEKQPSVVNYSTFQKGFSIFNTV
jgi:hypothetical protein